MKEERDNKQQMFSNLARRYDLANDVLSLGIHRHWKQRLLKAAKLRASLAVDLCTGTGDLLPGLAAISDQLLGIDISKKMLYEAERKISLFQDKIELIVADAASIPLGDNLVDLVTIAFGIRNIKLRETIYKEVLRILKPGGIFLILEFGQPRNLFWRLCYNAYSLVFVPLIGSILTGEYSSYRYLVSSSKIFPSGEAFASELSQHGFDDVEWEPQSGGICFIYKGTKK